MRSPGRRPTCLALVGACAAVVLPLGIAPPASAASWTTLANVDGARPQACKIPAAEGRSVKIRVRQVNGSPEVVTTSFSVTRDGRTVSRVQMRMQPGQTSAVRVLRLPDTRTHQFGFGLSTDEGGLGDTDALRYTGRC